MESSRRSQWPPLIPSNTGRSSSGLTQMASTPARAVADASTPTSATTAFNFKSVLQRMIQQNASDLHLKVGRPPVLRIDGDLHPLEIAPLRPEDLKLLAEQVMTPKQVKEFTEHKESDFAIGVPGIGRFRVNVYQQRGTIAYALRAVPYQVKTIGELNLPPVITDIALRP